MKIGDKIVCKQDKGSNSLQLNKEYIIIQINFHGNVGLQENFGGKFLLPHFYKPERFVIVKEKTKNIDWANKTYKTRNGLDVNLFCLSNSKDYPVVGEFKSDVGWQNGNWTLDGYLFENKEPSEYDLVEVKNKETIDCDGFLVTVYRDGSVHLSGAGSYHLNESLNKEIMEKIFAAWNGFVDNK